VSEDGMALIFRILEMRTIFRTIPTVTVNTRASGPNAAAATSWLLIDPVTLMFYAVQNLA
jgi:hypothetical protein